MTKCVSMCLLALAAPMTQAFVAPGSSLSASAMGREGVSRSSSQVSRVYQRLSLLRCCRSLEGFVAEVHAGVANVSGVTLHDVAIKPDFGGSDMFVVRCGEVWSGFRSTSAVTTEAAVLASITAVASGILLQNETLVVVTCSLSCYSGVVDVLEPSRASSPTLFFGPPCRCLSSDSSGCFVCQY